MDFQIVCRKYDLRNNGTFAYRHFLQQMVLQNNSKNSTSNLNGTDGQGTARAAPGIRALLKTAECWRDLRKWFRGQPQTSPGVISIGQLRHGLRTVTDANMTEEEFADLTNRLDPQMTGYFKFDDLFRLALKSKSKNL